MTNLPPVPNELSFQDVRIVFSNMTAGDPSKGFVPGYHFRIVDEQGEDVGHLNYRVGNTEHVRLAAGHLGFEINEAHRGNHFAAKACMALAPWLSEYSDPILITVDPDNIGSVKTIERIGAEFIDTVDVPKGDPHYLRGSFRKRRYRWLPQTTSSKF